MANKTPHDEDRLAKAMRDSDRGEDIQAIARILFTRRGQQMAAEETVQHFVVHRHEKEFLSPFQVDARDLRRDAA